ncbi:MAG: hypothetical protein ACYTGB_04270 [Planctomycetota bacterium]|jgi:hypothetical protein
MIPVAIASIIAAIAIPSALQLNEQGHSTIAWLIIVPVALAVVASMAFMAMTVTSARPLVGLSFVLVPAATIGLLWWIFGVVALKCTGAVLACLFGAVPALYGMKSLFFDVTYSVVLRARGRLKSSAPVWISAVIAAGCLAFGFLFFLGAWALPPACWRIGVLVWMGLAGLLGACISLKIKENLKDYASEYGRWIRG